MLIFRVLVNRLANFVATSESFGGRLVASLPYQRLISQAAHRAKVVVYLKKTF